mmetsp:Transcript_28435/g.84079  ORF Transcript_28435/g.84079 Transcript_28435/m.84079 type:complete len:236 (-) Transcript_28435:77-784(-)
MEKPSCGGSRPYPASTRTSGSTTTTTGSRTSPPSRSPPTRRGAAHGSRTVRPRAVSRSLGPRLSTPRREAAFCPAPSLRHAVDRHVGRARRVAVPHAAGPLRGRHHLLEQGDHAARRHLRLAKLQAAWQCHRRRAAVHPQRASLLRPDGGGRSLGRRRTAGRRLLRLQKAAPPKGAARAAAVRGEWRPNDQPRPGRALTASATPLPAVKSDIQSSKDKTRVHEYTMIIHHAIHCV